MSSPLTMTLFGSLAYSSAVLLLYTNLVERTLTYTLLNTNYIAHACCACLPKGHITAISVWDCLGQFCQIAKQHDVM